MALLVSWLSLLCFSACGPKPKEYVLQVDEGKIFGGARIEKIWEKVKKMIDEYKEV